MLDETYILDTPTTKGWVCVLRDIYIFYTCTVPLFTLQHTYNKGLQQKSVQNANIRTWCF